MFKMSVMNLEKGNRGVQTPVAQCGRGIAGERTDRAKQTVANPAKRVSSHTTRGEKDPFICNQGRASLDGNDTIADGTIIIPIDIYSAPLPV